MKQFKITFADVTYTVNFIDKTEEAEKVAVKLGSSETPCFGLDIETYKDPQYFGNKQAGLEPHLSGISTVQLYDGKETIWVFDAVKAGLEWFHKVKDKRFVAHYGIFEIKHLTHAGFPDLEIGCSMLLSILVDRAERSPFVPYGEEDLDIEDEDEPSSWKGYGLDAIIGRLFDLRIDKKFQLHDWNARPLDREALSYAALDAVLTYKIADVQVPKINEYRMQKHYKLLKDMQHVIAEMELAGVKIDGKQHKKIIQEWELQHAEEAVVCIEHFGNINFNSTTQLAKWAKVHYPPDVIENWPVTAKGALGFGKTALSTKCDLPEIKALLEYKKTAKLISTYGETLALQENPVTGRIHCSFSLGETRTGRLSSRNPNLQNIPRESSIRDLFVPATSHRLVVADFNQIELRVAGEVSSDPVIKGAYRDGKDLHAVFASNMFRIPLDKVTKEQRQIAKSANFGAIYGMGAAKFVSYTLTSTGGEVKLTFEEAKRAIENLWSLYSVYGVWCKKVRNVATEVGFVRTPMGKMRKLHSDETYTKAPNTIIQGGAFEVMSYAMLNLKRSIYHSKIDAKIINSVHDEIIVESPKQETQYIKGLIETAMVIGMRTVFPTAITNGLAKAVVCDSWGEGKK